jgi:hypothetical protein
MWTTIITALLPIVVKLLGMLLDWKGASEQEKKDFLAYLEKVEAHNVSCVGLRKSYVSQRDANLNKIKNMNSVK